MANLHAEDAHILNNVASARFHLGEYKLAENLYLRALSEWEKQPEVTARAIAMSNLATLYRTMGRYAEAETLFRRTLETLSRTAGMDSVEAETVWGNMGELFRRQGRLEEAEQAVALALAIGEKQPGGDPRRPHLLHALATVYAEQGRHDEALMLYMQALELRAGDPVSSAITMTNLATVYTARREYQKAQPWAERAYRTLVETMGPSHPHTAVAANNLAQVYRLQGRYAEAEPLYREALAAWEKALGPNSIEVAQGLRNLADFFEERGKLRGAIELFQRASSILEERLGREHIDVLVLRARLAGVYRALGRNTESAALVKAER